VVLHGLADTDQVATARADLEAAGTAEVRYFGADLREVDQIDAMMDDLAAWGGIDILVNSAGIQRTASLEQVTPELWSGILAVNLSAAFHTMRRALPGMAKRGYGRAINIASVHGLVASVNKAPYVASKFGLVGLSRVAALEYARAGTKASGGVTVNCICPGWTETAIIEPQVQARATELGVDREAGIASLLSEKQPTQRTSDPSEIADLALLLCAPTAHNITGTAIAVDGGWTAQQRPALLSCPRRGLPRLRSAASGSDTEGNLIRAHVVADPTHNLRIQARVIQIERTALAQTVLDVHATAEEMLNDAVAGDLPGCRAGDAQGQSRQQRGLVAIAGVEHCDPYLLANAGLALEHHHRFPRVHEHAVVTRTASLCAVGMTLDVAGEQKATVFVDLQQRHQHLPGILRGAEVVVIETRIGTPTGQAVRGKEQRVLHLLRKRGKVTDHRTAKGEQAAEGLVIEQ